MSTKPNMYRGILTEAQKLVDEVKSTGAIYRTDEDGNRSEILAWDLEKTDLLRDKVSRELGILEFAMINLDSGSKYRVKYEECYKHLAEFMRIYEQHK